MFNSFEMSIVAPKLRMEIRKIELLELQDTNRKAGHRGPLV